MKKTKTQKIGADFMIEKIRTLTETIKDNHSSYKTISFQIGKKGELP
jgi:hypothetical protein